MSIPYPQSIEEIADESVKNKLLTLKTENHVLGFLLQGSRVTGFGTPDTDWDIIVYCTDEYYNTLDYHGITEYTFDGEGKMKKMVGDYAYFSDQIFVQQYQSPMDIDHVPYTLSVVLWDKTGKLSEWVEKLADFPEAEYQERVRLKLVQLLIAFGYARINKVRERWLDVQINLNRALTIALSYWFTLQKSWTPQFKWWSNHVKRLGMDEITFNIYKKCIENLNFENVESLIEHLKMLTIELGISPSYQEDFYSTLMIEGRRKYIKYSYF